MVSCSRMRVSGTLALHSASTARLSCSTDIELPPLSRNGRKIESGSESPSCSAPRHSAASRASASVRGSSAADDELAASSLAAAHSW